MKPNLSIIAEKTGYSMPTVSRVLSGKVKGRSKSVDKILKAARMLGYSYAMPVYPNSVVLPKIVLVTEHFAEEFYSCLYESFDRISSQRNLDLKFQSIKYSDDIVNALVLISKLNHGIILMIPSLTIEQYVAIQTALPDFPIVNMAPSEKIFFPAVTHDSYEGGKLAADCLISAGYKTFGLISGPNIKLESNLRRSGFIEGLRKHNFNISWEYSGDYSFKAGEKAFQDLTSKKKKKLGIFAANDQMALGFIHTALEKGRNIPGDMGIVGYDNMPYGQVYYPRLTTINTDLDELCKAAFDIIIRLIQNPNEKSKPTTTVLSVDLIERKTHYYETQNQ